MSEFCNYCAKKAEFKCGDCHQAYYCSEPCFQVDKHYAECGLKIRKKKDEEVCLSKPAFFQTYFELWQIVSERWTAERDLTPAEEQQESLWVSEALPSWDRLPMDKVPKAIEELTDIVAFIAQRPVGTIDRRKIYLPKWALGQ